MDKLKSLLEDLDNRLRSPFIISFLTAWLIWNWELVFIFFNFDPKTALPFKLDIIHCYISDHPWKLTVIPLGLCFTAAILFYFMSLLFLSMDALYQEKFRPKIMSYWAPASVVPRLLYETTIQRLEESNKKVNEQKLDFAESTSRIAELNKAALKMEETNKELNEKMATHEELALKAEKYDEITTELDSLKDEFFGEWFCEFQFTENGKITRGGEKFTIQEKLYYIGSTIRFTIKGVKLFNDVLEFDKVEFQMPQNIRHTKVQKIGTTLWLGTETMAGGNYSIVRYYPSTDRPKDTLFRFLNPNDSNLQSELNAFMRILSTTAGTVKATGLSILKPTYGSDRKEIDVLEKIIKIVKSGQKEFVVNNTLFGDPDPGFPKKLVIESELDGEKKSATYLESAKASLYDKDY